MILFPVHPWYSWLSCNSWHPMPFLSFMSSYWIWAVATSFLQRQSILFMLLSSLRRCQNHFISKRVGEGGASKRQGSPSWEIQLTRISAPWHLSFQELKPALTDVDFGWCTTPSAKPRCHLYIPCPSTMWCQNLPDLYKSGSTKLHENEAPGLSSLTRRWTTGAAGLISSWWPFHLRLQHLRDFAYSARGTGAALFVKLTVELVDAFRASDHVFLEGLGSMFGT